MTEPLNVSALTPSDHITTLNALAQHYEKAAKHFAGDGADPVPGSITALYLRRAHAIRWLLSETAHGVDVSELAT